jgi:hypothetical protein
MSWESPLFRQDTVNDEVIVHMKSERLTSTKVLHVQPTCFFREIQGHFGPLRWGRSLVLPAYQCKSVTVSDWPLGKTVLMLEQHAELQPLNLIG